MPVESEADRAAFLDVDEHGVSATITASGASPVTIPGIFDEGYSLLADGDGSEGVSSAEPTLLVQSSLLPSVSLIGATMAATILETARAFTIVEPKPDGTGMTELRLHETT
ncbi:hypothetical protein [Hoeflea sp. TYP-13]|uniref:head-tail joining protein n=1 Tax=Hoeflea sp. TYP-13 TaxID=3230023 RepID=UPI0034C5EB88